MNLPPRPNRADFIQAIVLLGVVLVATLFILWSDLPWSRWYVTAVLLVFAMVSAVVLWSLYSTLNAWYDDLLDAPEGPPEVER